MKKLILGTVQMGLKYGLNNKNSSKISLDKSKKILHKAFLSGIETLDTAYGYGDAHKVIGEFHKENSECKFKIITKLPFNISEKDNILSICNDYLKQLNIETIEVLMFHSFESYYKNRNSLVLLNGLKDRGKIKHIGVSVYTNDELKYLIDNEPLVTVIQLPFNLFDNNFVRGELLIKAKRKNKIIHTRSAFLQGLFYMNPNESNVIVNKLKFELSLINKISVMENCSISDLALGYCIKQEYIDNVIIGVDSIEQLIENIKSSSYLIKDEAVQKINKIQILNHDLLNPSLWGKIQY
jgi:aryl-alcohol dehydrogenase-like predicted oxidoreductase